MPRLVGAALVAICCVAVSVDPAYAGSAVREDQCEDGLGYRIAGIVGIVALGVAFRAAGDGAAWVLSGPERRQRRARRRRGARPCPPVDPIARQAGQCRDVTPSVADRRRRARVRYFALGLAVATVAVFIPTIALVALVSVSGLVSWIALALREMIESGYPRKAVPPRVMTGRWTFRAGACVCFGSYVAVFGLVLAYASAGDLVCPYEPDRATTVVMAFGCIFAGALVFRGARRLAMLSAEESMRIDDRPAVLYLRSFADERVKIKSRRSGRRLWLERLGGPSRERFEEVLAWHLWRYGPLVTIAGPGWRGPKLVDRVVGFFGVDIADLQWQLRADLPRRLGAVRETLSATTWQRDIEDWIGSARLIIVALGRTEGLGWEIERLTRLGLWSKAILVFPPVGDEELDRRWRTFREIASAAGLHVTLPADPGSALVAVVRLADGMIVYAGRRHDEWHYEAAIEEAAVTLGVGPARPPPRFPITTGDGRAGL